MDGAGPHQCKKLRTMIDEEFNRRGWIFRFQPIQNPEINVKDSCVFPRLSRLVTKKQGRSNRSYILKKEDLWKTVMNCWEEMPNEVLAQAYSLHHQIVNAIIVNNGKNDFLYEKGGLHFGCRKQFIVDEDGGGVHYIPVDNDLDEPDTIRVENDGKLKYQRPNISTYLAGTYLNEQPRNWLISGMELGSMSEEAEVSWEEVWDKLY